MDDSPRIVIWAAVSTKPQAEKDSISDQQADGRAFVARRGGIVVGELIVPGESRSYPTIAEAIDGMGEDCAYERLMALIKSKSFDILWCRSLDRLGRTDPLISEVQYRCRQAGALVYSEQMPPTGQVAGDLYLSAIERAGAQREIVEFQRRTHYGMNARARKGHIVAAVVPFGYREEWRDKLRHAVVEPNEAAAYRWAVDATLNRTHTQMQITARLASLFPPRFPNPSCVQYMLRNPFYAGLIVRKSRGPDGRNMEIVSEGLHEPLVDRETWDELQAFLLARRRDRRPPSKSLWAGIVYCEYCGRRMYFHRVKSNWAPSRVYLNFVCANRKTSGTCEWNTITVEEITTGVATYLRHLYAELADQVKTHLAPDVKEEKGPELERQRTDVLRRRDRLTMLFQIDRITLEEYDIQRAAIMAELAEIDAELGKVRADAERLERRRANVEMLAEILPDLANRLVSVDPAEANRWLKQIFRAVYVANREVVRIELA